MAYAEGVLVIHWPQSKSFAVRLAMDLRSAGISAHPTAIETLSASDWQKRLPGVTGVVVIYGGGTWVLSDMEAALDDLHPKRPVVFVRSSSRKFYPEFNRFWVVPAMDVTASSYYQPHQKTTGAIST